MGPMGFFSKLKLRDTQKIKIRKIVTCVCGVGYSLAGRSYFWQELPEFFGAKDEHFTVVPRALFDLSRYLSETSQWRSGKIIEIYVAQVVLTNARVGFGNPPPIFTRGKNCNFGKIFDKVLNWRLTVPQGEGIWEIKNNIFIVDYRTTSTPNLVGSAE